MSATSADEPGPIAEPALPITLAALATATGIALLVTRRRWLAR